RPYAVDGREVEHDTGRIDVHDVATLRLRRRRRRHGRRRAARHGLAGRRPPAPPRPPGGGRRRPLQPPPPPGRLSPPPRCGPRGGAPYLATTSGVAMMAPLPRMRVVSVVGTLSSSTHTYSGSLGTSPKRGFLMRSHRLSADFSAVGSPRDSDPRRLFIVLHAA